jgi:hypothetical protein
MGLNACDLESYGLTDGIDSDQDDIPDLVEILKLTRPNVDDTMFNNDGDELYLYQEIAVGRSPNYKDDNVSPLTLMEYTNNKSPTPLNGCPENQESWSYIIDQVPLVPTIATNNIYEADLRLDFLNHDTDENIIFIYYIIKELNNSDASTSLLFGKFIKVNYDTGEKQELSEFKQLGVVDGEF